jgi:hypothetical protein
MISPEPWAARSAAGLAKKQYLLKIMQMKIAVIHERSNLFLI